MGEKKKKEFYNLYIYQKQQSQSKGHKFVFPPFPIFKSSVLYILYPSSVNLF